MLSIQSNIASLFAQQNLNSASDSLNTSLQRLSSGLKINTGADGPAALVISNEQGAQIAGLQSAIDNTNQAVSMVQTAEGALSTVNNLLVQIRGLALSAANSAVNDPTALAADQAQIANALQTINNISSNTQFGTKKLLDGSAQAQAVVSGVNNASITPGSIVTGPNTTAGSYVVNVTHVGTGATFTGTGTAVDNSTGTPTVGGSGGSLLITGGGLANAVSVSLASTDTSATAVTKIQAALDAAAGSGTFLVGMTGAANVQHLTIQSNILGSAAITATADANSTLVTGVTTTVDGGGAAGSALQGTINGVAVNGSGAFGNQLVAPNLPAAAGAAGLGVTLTVTAATLGAAATSVTAGNSSTVSVSGSGLVFQIGANANQTAAIAIQSVATTNLGVNVAGLNNPATSSLSKIDVTTTAGANDTLKIVDAAISQISTLSGSLGSFQTNTLQATATNLQTALTNTTAAQSVIRDTNFAAETANFTKDQVLVQAGTTVLTNANATAQLILNLLK